MISFVSNLPGRLRLKSSKLRDTKLLARLERSVAGMRGVTSTRANATAACLVVHFTPSDFDATAFDRDVASFLQTSAAFARSISTHVTRTRTANRLAKVGALTSLGVSLGAAAAGRKRLHIAAGASFLAFLGVHLVVHRRHVLK